MQTRGRRFTGPNLLQIAMPMGGLGAGCICLNGQGGLVDFSIRNRPATTAVADGHQFTDAAFALLHVRGTAERPAITRLVEGPLPPERLYDQGLQAQGYRRGGQEGMPRFAESTFEGQYPFGTVRFTDASVPLQVSLTGWNPFIPLDDVNSGLPCVLLEYRFENPTSETVSFTFSYHLSHLADRNNSRVATGNAPIGPTENGAGGGVFFTNQAEPHSEEFGSAALYVVGQTPRIKAMWFRGGWFDSLSVLWREIDGDTFRENDGTGADQEKGRNGGSILIDVTLAPGESLTCPIVLAWYFPNSEQRYGEAPKPAAVGTALPMAAADCGPGCDCGPDAVPASAWRPFYAGQWADARAVARYAAAHYDALRARTRAFADALHGSTLPPEAIDAISANLAILKSPTVLRQENGNVWGWEGCFAGSGCCHGSCTHVWNYAQAMPHLFPALERTLREQELLRSQDDRGHINFRSALPDGPTGHGFHAAADGQLGGILKLYRDWQISGDGEWLARLYPAAKRSLDYGIRTWDPDRRGGLFEPHHNTYDIEFWGPDGMCGSIYVGALSAMAEMARTLGHDKDATEYGELADRAASLMDTTLFNGDYYEQKVQWEGLHDTSFADRMAAVTEETSEMLRLEKAEGPKYQYGTGCLADGVIGAWMARLYGVETPLDREHIRRHLDALFTHNFKSDLSEHACLQRPGYALGHEPGLLLCSWPRGNKPTLPFVYSDEVWTGIEYEVASYLIAEGRVEEGLTLVRAARSRYEGRVRNPFNEYECGSYYARAMSSYALLQALTGFRYTAPTRTLYFGPPQESKEPFTTFFCAASGFGIIHYEPAGGTLSVEMIEGELAIEQLYLTRGDQTETIDWRASARPGQAAVCALTPRSSGRGG